MDREKFLKLSLAYAEANKIAFDEINVDNSLISKNVKLANQARKKLDKLCKESKENGALNSVEAFMEHEDKYVRCLAAMYSLFTNPTVAEQELEKLMGLPKPNAVGAQAMTILEVWRKGLMVL